MAFCTKCGNQLVDGAQFCTACGAATTAVPPAAETPAAPAQAAPRKRSPLLWIVPAVVLGLVALGAGGWFAFGLISGGTQSGRARAQAEAVADLYEGYSRGDVALIESAIPEELHGQLDTEGLGEDDTVTVVRKWDGDTLTMTTSSEEYDWETVLTFASDGAKDRAVVTVTDISAEEQYESTAVVARSEGRWIVVEVDGTPIHDALGTTDADDEYGDDESGDEEYYDDADTSDGSGNMQEDNEAAECMANQEIIESVLWEYMELEGYDDTVPLAGDLSWDHPIVADGYLEVPPSCASAPDAYYYIARDGTTSCPTGEHGYYLDEQ